MENLKELIGVVTKNKVKRIEMLGNPANYASNLQKLYDGIAEGKIDSDEVAADFFFSENENKQIYYNRLKRNLNKRLINTLFFIDVNQPSFNEVQKAYYICYKDFAAFKVLIGRGARKSALQLGEKTLKKAIRFEFTELIVDVARHLRLHYGTVEGNRNKFKEYNEIVKKYIDILHAELLSEEYFIDLAINFVKSRSTKMEIEDTATQYAEELRTYTNKYDSFQLNLTAYNVFALRYQIVNDYRNTLIVCEEAVKFFKSRKYSPKITIFTFLFKMLSCHLQLKNYERGEKIAKQCLEYENEGHSNWFATLESYTILLFHSKQFQKANEIYRQAIDHSNFKFLNKNYKEQWLIVEAFVNYFISIGKIEKEGKEKGGNKKFRISKFLNEVPNYSKDKRGTNVTILILQILFLLQRKKFGDVIDRMEALTVYCHRYLRKDDTFRSNCFIKMLLQLPSAHFNKTAAIRKVKKYHDLLEKNPLEMANQGSEIEIVPYEMLWEFVLESLDNKFHYS